MDDEIVGEVVKSGGSERVIVVRRPDGLFSYRLQFPHGDDWGGPGPYCGVYDTAETAKREATLRRPWLPDA